MCDSCKNSGPPLAAIWWRVSTEDQKTISPDTHIGEALLLAQQEGYQVPEEFIIGTDWGSLSVWESPAMNLLKDLIRNGSVHAVFMYDADRGPSKPVHRLIFRAMCEEANVKIRCRHGQIPDGEMGEVMEFLSAWAKEKQVHRAQQGSKDGLRDRAAKKGLPVNNKPPYGYQFCFEERGGKRIPVALEPSITYPVVKQICHWALAGKPIRKMCHELVIANIPAPRGGSAWYPGTIHTILTNPVYAGRYCALRSYAREPKARQKDTYGNSTCGRRPQEDWVWLDDFPVASPVVSWLEWEAVQERLKLNQTESRRRAKRVFTLTGMLFCGECGKRLSGFSVPKQGYYGYRCSGRYGQYIGMKSCPSYDMNGSTAESAVWGRVSSFLQEPRQLMAEINHQQSSQPNHETECKRQLEALRRKLHNVDAMDTELVAMKLRGQVIEDVFKRNLALNKAERAYLTEEIDRQQVALESLNRSQDAVESLVGLQEQIGDRLLSASLEDQRWVLQTLSTRITVNQDGLVVSIGIPAQSMETVADSTSCTP